MKALRGGCWFALGLSTALFNGAAAATPEPRLTGIVQLENRRLALLELHDESRFGAVITRNPILREGERDGTYDVIAINEKSAKVTLRHATDETIELSLGQGPTEELANRSVNLRSASLEQVLEIYQMLSARTVIRSLKFPEPRLDLKSGAGLSKADATALLAKALTEKGMLLRPQGDKFLVLVPTSEEKLLAAIPKPPSPEAGPDEVLPPGMVKFQEGDLLQVLDIYGDLTGRTVLRPQSLPWTKISVRSETPLTRNEAVWLLDALFSVSGIAMVPEGERFVFSVPTSRVQNLPKFDPRAAAAKARKAAPPQAIRFHEAGLTKLLETYATLLDREPLPVGRQVAAVKFSLRTQQELNQAEAIFALEAVAALNNLRLELVGEDQVQIGPAAAARNIIR